MRVETPLSQMIAVPDLACAFGPCALKVYQLLLEMGGQQAVGRAGSRRFGWDTENFCFDAILRMLLI